MAKKRPTKAMLRRHATFEVGLILKSAVESGIEFSMPHDADERDREFVAREVEWVANHYLERARRSRVPSVLDFYKET